MNVDTSTLKRSGLSLLLLIAGCGFFVSTMGSSYADLGGAFSPVFFPRIILVAWIVLAFLSCVADTVGAHDEKSTRWLPVAIVSLALFAYIKFMPALGFFITSVAFCAIVLLATGQRRPLDVLIFSLAIPGMLVVLFNHLLTMPLPVSPFVWWL